MSSKGSAGWTQVHHSHCSHVVLASREQNVISITFFPVICWSHRACISTAVPCCEPQTLSEVVLGVGSGYARPWKEAGQGGCSVRWYKQRHWLTSVTVLLMPWWQFRPSPKCSHTQVSGAFCAQRSWYTEALVFTGFPTPSKTLAFHQQDWATNFRAAPLKLIMWVAIGAHPCREGWWQNNSVLIRIIWLLILSSKWGKGWGSPHRAVGCLGPCKITTPCTPTSGRL